MKLSKKEFQKLKKGNPEIFENLYNEYKKKIFNYLLIKTSGNYDIAEDILSDTFHSIFTSISKLKTPKNIQAWILQIASRRYNDYLRQLYRDKKKIELIKTYKLSKEQDNVYKNIIKEEKILLLTLAMEKLDPENQKVLKLCYIEEKSMKQVAEIISKTPKAVENMLYRAKKTMKTEIRKLERSYF